jgi:sialic acid synthase SpsE/uncharacterized cupin superfamily protein
MFEKLLFIFDMANNHMGDVNHALRIVDELKKVTEIYDNIFNFAIKLQYRDLDTFIHPDFKDRFDIKYVKRFTETRLSWETLNKIKNYITERGFIAICTPFDENSVEKVVEHDFDIIKVASCSFTDWPLLENIVERNKPIIASTAGVSFDDIKRVVLFLKHRKKKFALMHCVAEYPTNDKNLQLNQIDFFKNNFPDIPVGYSTHESPENFKSIIIAIAKGAKIFEKHVGIPTEKYNINNYSATPSQISKWLENAAYAVEMCGVNGKRYSFGEDELKTLKSLQRGIFAKKHIKKNEVLVKEDVFFAIPTGEQQLTANDMSKYSQICALREIKLNEPITNDNSEYYNNFENVSEIVNKISRFVKNTNVTVPKNTELELSHHYGIEKFYEFGLSMITVVNREYCKKLLILLPGQCHPEQYHKVKEETFHVLFGNIKLTLDGVEKDYSAGDVVTIEPETKHIIYTDSGAIIEEISSTHCSDDSFYTDEKINFNKNRKTFIPFWLDSTL